MTLLYNEIICGSKIKVICIGFVTLGMGKRPEY